MVRVGAGDYDATPEPTSQFCWQTVLITQQLAPTHHRRHSISWGCVPPLDMNMASLQCLWLRTISSGASSRSIPSTSSVPILDLIQRNVWAQASSWCPHCCSSSALDPYAWKLGYSSYKLWAMGDWLYWRPKLMSPCICALDDRIFQSSSPHVLTHLKMVSVSSPPWIWAGLMNHFGQ